MAFTLQERVDIRRFCGYPMYGGVTSPAFGWRYFKSYGTLEFKISNLAAEEETTLRTIYLSGANSLYVLELAIFGANANLDTDVAAVWVHNKNEVRDRTALFDMVRRRLCGYLGIEEGPHLSSGGSISLVV
jgi:hypothetical protein